MHENLLNHNLNLSYHKWQCIVLTSYNILAVKLSTVVGRGVKLPPVALLRGPKRAQIGMDLNQGS